MTAELTIIGDDLLARDADGELKSHIGSLFPKQGYLVTVPTIHQFQREIYVDRLNEERAAAGRPPLTEEERAEEWEGAVDLIMEDSGHVLIRPNPDNMPLAFEADEALQRLIPKHRIKFQYALDGRVRDAVKRRGECWRITSLPTSPQQMRQMIEESRLRLGGEEIYLYNKTTGTRWLTCEQFAGLQYLDDDRLRAHLVEIREHSNRKNPRRYPEIDFFMAGDSFSKTCFAGVDFESMESAELRERYRRLRDDFFSAVPDEFHRDNLDDTQWRHRMFTSLIARKDDEVSEETLLGLSSEFFMQIQWLPGGRIQNRELIFDPVFDLREEDPGNQELTDLCDERARAFIFNFVRQYTNLEYVNIGRVVNSLSRRKDTGQRRGVYIAEIKQLGVAKEIVSIIRMQKWGVREHLADGKTMYDAIIQSDEYTEYVLDRRLGCRQLGMNLPDCVTARKICEPYSTGTGAPAGISSPYIERDYIAGIATDKIPTHRLEKPEFCERLAKLLGEAAAVNIIVGRCDRHGKVLFDDGDEVVIVDDDGKAVEIVVADPTGTFHSFERELNASVQAYAEPVNRRREVLPDPQAFAEAYLWSFERRFRSIQREYRLQRRAFDTLFKYRTWDPNGSFAFRWEQVLARLDRTDAAELTQSIREHVKV